jgi:prevent-host-death family protein
MGIITAKELKQKTGEMMRRVKRGERLTVTYRGTPIAALLPLDQADVGSEPSLRSLEETWGEIDKALEATEPEFKGWQEATAWVRKRTSS